jgi:hypothetical protein
MTLATSGRIGRNSSESAALQQSLENRLMTALDTAGSTLFKLTWKRRRTPLGRSYLERAVSAGRISGSGFTSWPSPDTGMNLTDANWEQRRQECKETHGQNGFGLTLGMASTLAGWPAPNQRDYKSASASPEFLEIQQAETRGHNLSVEATLAGWTTPQAHDATGRSKTQKEIHGTKHGCADLGIDAELAGWPSPCTPNGGRSMSTEAMDATGKTKDGRKHTASLEHAVKFANGPARLTAHGEMLTGSSAGMESGGQLRAGHSRWLMAIPAAWDGFACMAMQSISKLRRPSSKRTLKQVTDDRLQ